MAEDTLRHLPQDLVKVWVCYDPPERAVDVQAWLEPLLVADTEFLAQCPGDLGQRLNAVMEAAFALPGLETLTFMGTDCPEARWPVFVITRRMAAEGVDAVFGATEDGGYYLLTLRVPCPELFRDIPWSTDRTLAASLQAAEAAGRKTHLLQRVLRDIDTVEDLRASGVEC